MWKLVLTNIFIEDSARYGDILLLAEIPLDKVNGAIISVIAMTKPLCLVPMLGRRSHTF